MKNLIVLLFILCAGTIYSQSIDDTDLNFTVFNYINGGTCVLEGCFSFTTYGDRVRIMNESGVTYSLRPSEFGFADVVALRTYVSAQYQRLCVLPNKGPAGNDGDDGILSHSTDGVGIGIITTLEGDIITFCEECPPATQGGIRGVIRNDTVVIIHTDSDGGLQETYFYYDTIIATIDGIMTSEVYFHDGRDSTFVHESKCDLCLEAKLGNISHCDPRISTRDCDGGGFTNGLECQAMVDPNDPSDDMCVPWIVNNLDICAEILSGSTDGVTLSTMDCDGGGVDNGTECANGDDPADPNDDCPFIEGLPDGACTSSAYASTDCDNGGIDAGVECFVGTDPEDPADDCQAAILGQVSICIEIGTQTSHPLASQDCDGGGYPNAAECQAGLDPSDAANDTTCVKLLKHGVLDASYAVGETTTWTITYTHCGPFDGDIVITDALDPNSPVTISGIAAGSTGSYDYQHVITQADFDADSIMNQASIVLTDIYGKTASDDSDDSGNGDTSPGDTSGSGMTGNDASVLSGTCFDATDYDNMIFQVDNGDDLYNWNPDTDTWDLFCANIVGGGKINAIGYDPSTDIMYSVEAIPPNRASGTNDIIAFDLATCTPSVVGSTGAAMNSNFFASGYFDVSSGLYYFSHNAGSTAGLHLGNDYYSFDPSTGLSSFVCAIPPPYGESDFAMLNGKLYAVGTIDCNFYEVDLASCTSTILGQVGGDFAADGCGAVGTSTIVNCDEFIFHSNSTDKTYVIDINTLASTVIATSPFSGTDGASAPCATGGFDCP